MAPKMLLYQWFRNWGVRIQEDDRNAIVILRSHSWKGHFNTSLATPGKKLAVPVGNRNEAEPTSGSVPQTTFLTEAAIESNPALMPPKNVKRSQPVRDRSIVAAQAAEDDRARIDDIAARLFPKDDLLASVKKFAEIVAGDFHGEDIDELRAAQRWADNLGTEVQKKIKSTLAIEADGRVGFRMQANAKGSHRLYLVAYWRAKDGMHQQSVNEAKTGYLSKKASRPAGR